MNKTSLYTLLFISLFTAPSAHGAFIVWQHWNLAFVGEPQTWTYFIGDTDSNVIIDPSQVTCTKNGLPWTGFVVNKKFTWTSPVRTAAGSYQVTLSVSIKAQ